MSKSLLIRNIPDTLKDWIAEESHTRRMSQNQLIISLLDGVRAGDTSDMPLFDRLSPIETVINDSLPFAFADLFAGIGGFRIGLSKLGGRCVWSCEYDKFSQKTYREWFSEDHIFGDINQLETDTDIELEVPDHDVLAAGFPCQPFSIAGVSKKRSLGHADGFDCKRQGNLFFKIEDIVRVKRPPVLFLENVKNLKSHDRGRTWQIIYSVLSEQLGYEVFSRVIDASHWVPQHRERILIVCFDRDIFGSDVSFEFPDTPAGPKPRLASVLESRVPSKYTLSDHLWRYLREYAERHRRLGNGFGYGLVGRNGQARTMSARYYKDGSEILIRQGRGKNPRRLAPSEAARLMGFGEEYARILGHRDGFPQVVSDTQAYKQFGNAVVPAVVEAVGRQIVKTLWRHMAEGRTGCLLKKGVRRQVAAAVGSEG